MWLHWSSWAEKPKKKQPHLAKKKVLFHQDNARVHTCAVAIAKLHKLKIELFPHPPYSLDLPPSDFYLFPNMKKIACQEEICVKRGRHHQNRGLFWRTSKILLFEQLEKLIRCTNKFPPFLLWKMGHLLWKNGTLCSIQSLSIILFFLRLARILTQ